MDPLALPLLRDNARHRDFHLTVGVTFRGLCFDSRPPKAVTLGTLKDRPSSHTHIAFETIMGGRA